MIKRPNTIKMKRLLQQFIECDRSDRRQLRELQEDAKRLLGVSATEQAASSPRKPKSAR